MTSSLLDIQDSIQAPNLPENRDIVPLMYLVIEVLLKFA